MKRSTKFITLLLIASMALSVCACDIRRKGVDRIMLDEYDKPEHSVETTIPEPTETEPAPTEPDPTTPEPTTTTAPDTKYQPGEIKDTLDLIKLGESAIGMGYEDATTYLTQCLNIKEFTPVDGLFDSNNVPSERFRRYWDKNIDIRCDPVCRLPVKDLGEDDSLHRDRTDSCPLHETHKAHQFTGLLHGCSLFFRFYSFKT